MSSGQPPGEGKLPPTSDISQNVSTGLMNFGFQMLGSAVAEEFNDPKLAQPLAQIGSNITNTLRTRWYQKEQEDFNEMYGKKYQADSQALSKSMEDQMTSINRGELIDANGVITKIDPGSEAAGRMRDDIIRNTTMRIHELDDGLLQSAGKYANNPFIAQKMQSFMQSRTQMIGELTGPTMAQQSEANLAGTANVRADTRLKNRMPATGGGAGSAAEKKLSMMTPMELFQNKLNASPYEWMAYHTGTEDGRKRVAPYIEMAAAERKKELIAQDPDLSLYPEQLEIRVQEDNAGLLQRATGMYTEAALPGTGLPQMMSNHPDFAAAFPRPAKEVVEPIIKGGLTKQEFNNAFKSAQPHISAGLESIIRNNNPATIEEAIQRWDNEFLEGYVSRNFAKNKGAQEAAKEMKKQMRAWIEKNWGRIAIANEKYGRGPKGGAQGKSIGTKFSEFGKLSPTQRARLLGKKAAGALSLFDKELPGQ